jgi:LAGLIDADG endonuclease
LPVRILAGGYLKR